MADWIGQKTIDLTADDWLRLLMDSSIFGLNDLEMVMFVYRQPGHRSSATDIGHFMFGIQQRDKLLDNRIVANRITSQNKSIANRIYRLYNIEPPQNSDGGHRYWNLLFDGDPKRQTGPDGKWIWIMRPNLVKAVSWMLKSSNGSDDFHPDTTTKNGHGDELYLEGDSITVQSLRYERNPIARERCIEEKGCFCYICHFDFEATYGDVGKGKIHVHHVIPLSTRRGQHKIRIMEDLIPICPNCHYIIHSKKPPYTPDEVSVMITERENKGKQQG